MKVAVAFSGGKDSTYAIKLAKDMGYDVACLISAISKNEHSYMFHTPLMSLVSVQADAMEIPILKFATSGKKDVELTDLKDALKKAKKDFEIEGLVTGAIRSTYQATNFERVCDDVGIWCFNPLWLNESVIDDELKKMDIIISAVAGYPLKEDILGMHLNEVNFPEGINKVGEGGEFETFVLDATFFKKRIAIDEFDKEYENYNGRIIVKKFRVVEK